MRQRVTSALALALALTFTTSTSADELELFTRHTLQGVDNGAAYTGYLTIAPDGSYTGERVYQSGAHAFVQGRVRIDGKSLVLQSQFGLVGILSSSSSHSRRFDRLPNKQVLWRYDDPADADFELLTMPGEGDESEAEQLLRVLRRGGKWNWVLGRNFGKVDDDSGALILRSRQPESRHLKLFKRNYNLKTVISLNGTQDPEVNTTLQQEGIQHHVFGMTSTVAPTDAQLVGIFSLLLDDQNKPLLIHCNGGADRTGVISALYQFEFLGRSRAEALKSMRCHMWMAVEGTEIQGAYVELYQLGRIRQLLHNAGVPIPARYQTRPPSSAP